VLCFLSLVFIDLKSVKMPDLTIENRKKAPNWCYREIVVEYKGMRLDDDIGSFIRYMPQVDTYRESLSLLQAVWDNLALLGQLSGVGNEMGDTRESFFDLSQSLINQLGREHYQRVEDGLKMKASVSVDMMLRNLFERTADIGFLATDDAIRTFMRRAIQWQDSDWVAHRLSPESDAQKMQQRLQAYVAKYSVYNNVILLSPTGDVLFQLVETGVVHSQDILVDDALSTDAAYIEIFRQTDLLPHVAQPLIYAYRVADESGEALGVLCLCFDFQDECSRIFAELDDDSWAVMVLTDEKGLVIASHDPIQVPIGAAMRGISEGAASLQRFAGRHYLSVTRKGKGYQGYLGQGWMGHVMVPLDAAFEQDQCTSIDMPNVNELDVFSEALLSIPLQADAIQARLNRSVWNGNIKQARKEHDSGFGRALLNEVSQTGLKTKAVFSSAIENLYQTVIGATLENNRFLASLAVNIMDRNLYERANDCRWWALTDVFRQALAKEMIPLEEQNHIAQILSYINQLYTVYTGLVVYDMNGVVIAVSQNALKSFVGKPLSYSWVKSSLTLTDSQQYVVSDFEPTPLYAGQSTYIYAAAIMHPDDMSRAVGGIGIIFDSRPQFAAMLADAAPDGRGHDAFAVFYDGQQRIISTTHPSLAIGEFVPADMTQAQDQGSAILSCGLGRYTVGVDQSTGYREFKGQADAYQQTVYAAMFKRIGALAGDDSIQTIKADSTFNFKAQGDKKEVATVTIGRKRFGLFVTAVIESVDVQLMARVAVANSLFSGYIKYHGQPVPVLDLSSYLGEVLNHQHQAIVLEDNGVKFAVLVDGLGSIVSVPTSLILPIKRYAQEHLIAFLVSESESNAPEIMILSSEKIRDLVIGGSAIAQAMPDLAQLVEVATEE
jgi:chemotaxis signal transduction protein